MGERYNNLLEFEELSSTNDYANELAKRESIADFTIVRTDFQTKGRGQRGNYWKSNKGENLLFSVILHPKNIVLQEQFILSQCVALSIYETISLYCDNVQIKWPNDIYVGDNKICGILIENVLLQKQIDLSIIGIGININQTKFIDIPNPTSLQLELGKPLDIHGVLDMFMNIFQSNYKLIFTHPESIRKSYKSHLYLFNTTHTFYDVNGAFEGKIFDVQNDGKLIIIDENQNQRGYYFKEVKYKLTEK